LVGYGQPQEVYPMFGKVIWVTDGSEAADRTIIAWGRE
jgi:hypothetical protein